MKLTKTEIKRMNKNTKAFNTIVELLEDDDKADSSSFVKYSFNAFMCRSPKKVYNQIAGWVEQMKKNGGDFPSFRWTSWHWIGQQNPETFAYFKRCKSVDGRIWNYIKKMGIIVSDNDDIDDGTFFVRWDLERLCEFCLQCADERNILDRLYEDTAQQCIELRRKLAKAEELFDLINDNIIPIDNI